VTRVVVVSAAYGDYDKPATAPHQTVEPAAWLMVTDSPDVPPAPWQRIHEPRPGVHPRLAAKVPKCRPDLYDYDANVLIWMDASFEITSPDFVAWCLRHLGRAPLAQIRHPVRQDIHHEADVSQTMAKYQGLPLRAQWEHYATQGHPVDWGLWATGLIVYRRATCEAMGDAWLTEQVRFTYQDQISQPVVLRRLGLQPADLPGPLWGHPMFTIRPHESDL